MRYIENDASNKAVEMEAEIKVDVRGWIYTSLKAWLDLIEN